MEIQCLEWHHIKWWISVNDFVVMIVLYIASISVKCIDVFMSEFEEEMCFMMIPFVWSGASLLIRLMLLRWMNATEITNLS